MFLLGSVSSSPVERRSWRPVRSTGGSSLVLLEAREGNTVEEPRQNAQQFELPAGEALDLFYR